LTDYSETCYTVKLIWIYSMVFLKTKTVGISIIKDAPVPDTCERFPIGAH